MSVVLPGRGFFFVLNSVRVPNIQLLTYTQIFVESPLRVYRGLCYNGVRHIRYPMQNNDLGQYSAPKDKRPFIQ